MLVGRKASPCSDGLPDLSARVVWIGFSAPTISSTDFQLNETYANEVLSVTIPRPPTACRPTFSTFSTRNAELPILSKMPCILIHYSNSIDWAQNCVPLKMQFRSWGIWMCRNITSHFDSNEHVKSSWTIFILISMLIEICTHFRFYQDKFQVSINHYFSRWFSLFL